MPAPDDPQFVRRVAAVLVTEHDPEALGSGGNGANAVADAVQVLRAAGGDAEAFAANAAVAVFDDPSDAVTAATRLHLHAVGEGAREWRAGVHVGDVVMTAEGTATLEAIDRAVALARVARHGTTAITSDALAALRSVRDAVVEPLGTIDLPGAPRASVHLVVPRLSAPVLDRRRMVALLAGTAVVGGAGAVVWIARRRPAAVEDGPNLTVAVGPFRSSGSDQERAWIGVALRDGLNTQLSELSGVQVFSDEFVDFLMTREGLSTIEVATRLGIEKMVSGSVVTVGDTVRVEARIVDVATGLLDGAYSASAREQDFLALESDVVVGVIAKLPVQLSSDDERRLAARRTTDLRVLRRFLDAEIEPEPVPPAAGTTEPPPPSGGAPVPDSPDMDDRDSWLRDLLAPRGAHAEDVPAGVSAFLEEYRRATEARDVAAVATMYMALQPEQRDALERYFGSVRDFRVGIDRVEAAVVGEEAVVTYTRTDDFVDVETGKPQHVSMRLTKTLRRVDGRWRFTSSR